MNYKCTICGTEKRVIQSQIWYCDHFIKENKKIDPRINEANYQLQRMNLLSKMWADTHNIQEQDLLEQVFKYHRGKYAKIIVNIPQRKSDIIWLHTNILYGLKNDAEPIKI